MAATPTAVRQCRVQRITFGPRFALDGHGALVVDRDRLVAHLREDARLREVTVDLAHPGDDAKVVGVLDTAEPRCFLDEGRETFPGVAAPARVNVGGTLLCLRGAAVVVCGWEPWFDEHTHGVQMPFGAFIDMSGEGTRVCQNADTANLVVGLRADATPAAYAALTRETVARAARFVAGQVRESRAAAEAVDRPLVPEPASGVRRVVYIDQIRDQGLFVGTWFYGWPLTHLLPTVVTPSQLFEGALVTGDYRGTLAVPTYLHQNNPVVCSLLAAQARGDLALAGIVLSRGNFESVEDKRRNGELAAHLALTLGADGVIVSIEGFGNATVDFMETIGACARRDIPAVGIIHEPVVNWSERATHLVSVGAGMALGEDAGIEISSPCYLGGTARRVGATHRESAGATDHPTASRLAPFAMLWRQGEMGVTCRDF